MQLRDAVAIVTGAAGGLGRAFAERILECGGRVFITDIAAEQLSTTGQQLMAAYGETKIAWMVQDIADPDSFQRVFERAVLFFGRPINVLVNNAGISGDGKLWNDDLPRSWEKVISIDLTALIRGAQVGIHHMKKHLGGKEAVIVNVASFAGLYATAFSPEYGAAKHGVVGFTRACFPLKQEANIRVVCLAPAFVKTKLGRMAEKFLPGYVDLVGGVMDVSQIVPAFDLALQDETNTGRVISIDQTGHAYHEFANDRLMYPSAKM